MMRCLHVGGISNRAPAFSDYRQLKKITVLVRVLSCSLCRLNRYATYPSALPAEPNGARHNLSGILNLRYFFCSQYCSVASNGILLLPRMNSTPSPRIHEIISRPRWPCRTLPYRPKRILASPSSASSAALEEHYSIAHYLDADTSVRVM